MEVFVGFGGMGDQGRLGSVQDRAFGETARLRAGKRGLRHMEESLLLLSEGNESDRCNYGLLLGIAVLGSVNLETDGVLAEGNDLPGTGEGLHASLGLSGGNATLRDRSITKAS